MIYKGKKSGIDQNFTMDVDPGPKKIENFYGGLSWYMIESENFFSIIVFKLENEKNNFVSSNGQTITFRLSIKKIESF